MIMSDNNEHIHHGTPIVEGTLKDDVSVNNHAYVGPQATIQDNAYVSDDADIEGRAIIGGNAEIWENATVKGDAVVDGNARVGGHIVIGEKAHIGGDADIGGEGYIGGFAEISSDDDYVIVQGLTSRPLTVYKSSIWGVEVAVGFEASSLEAFLEYREFPQTLKQIVGLIAKKWQE